MKCKKCNGILFKIQVIPCCDYCDQNAAYDHDTGEYTYGLKVIREKGLTMDHVGVEGECKLGTAFGAGCYLFICNNCRTETNLPVADRC